MPKLATNGTIIERVSHAKVLGVTLSANLICWNMHVENIVRKESKQKQKRLYMLYQVKRAGSEQKEDLFICNPTSVGICVSSMASTSTKLHERYRELNVAKSRPYDVFTRGRLYEDLLR